MAASSSLPFLIVNNLQLTRSGKKILNGISFEQQPGEVLAITGPSGSGKTSLGLAIARQLFFSGDVHYNLPGNRNIVWMDQQHHFKNLQSTSDLYYQQRFNSYDTEETVSVAEELGQQLEQAMPMVEEMGISYLLTEKLIQLSNGENKKLQLLKSLLADPALLIMDQPFTGLDKATRNWLNDRIVTLCSKGTEVILICSADEIPGCVHTVLTLQEGKAVKSVHTPVTTSAKQSAGVEDNAQESAVPVAGEEPVIELKGVTIRYQQKLILDAIHWKVMPGECWLLTGPNGAGKSTLLSLLTADNPQAYANPVWLFGKKRGSGESIWDIKKKTGYISPELHLYFNESSTCFETVASGLFDTIGLFRSLNEDEAAIVSGWLDLCGLRQLHHIPLRQLSTGEQRMALLARALVKDPPLLILDEPLQGLDPEQKHLLIDLVNRVCTITAKTLIFVSHYEHDRPACINRFLRLEKGRRVQ